MKHCGPHKTPWRVVYNKDGGVDGIYGEPCNEFCRGRIVETDGDYYPPGPADAELIVAAVNGSRLARKKA